MSVGILFRRPVVDVVNERNYVEQRPMLRLVCLVEELGNKLQNDRIVPAVTFFEPRY